MNRNRYEALLGKIKDLALQVSRLTETRNSFSIMRKGEQDFVTEIDLQISKIFSKELPSLLEGSIVISEEEQNEEKQNCKYRWIVDPIDGTTNFIYQQPDYAISIGLLEDMGSVLGVIYCPVRDEMFYAFKDGGSFCNGEKISVCNDSAVKNTLVTAEANPYGDRAKTKFTDVFKEIYQDCVDYRITGSAAVDCCYVACGRAGAFIAESLSPWDYAAGEIIIKEAGGNITQWNGKDLAYSGKTTAVASNGQLHKELLKRLKPFT